MVANPQFIGACTPASASIPFFFLLMGVEWLAATLLERDVYRLNDVVNNLQTGILQQVLGVFSKVLVFGVYVAVYEWWRMIEMEAGSWTVWALSYHSSPFANTSSCEKKYGSFGSVMNTSGWRPSTAHTLEVAHFCAPITR